MPRRETNHNRLHHRRLRRCLALVAVQTLLTGAAPAVHWQDTTRAARSQASEESDSKSCLYQIILSQRLKGATSLDTNAADRDFMTCMTAKGWKAVETK